MRKIILILLLEISIGESILFDIDFSYDYALKKGGALTKILGRICTTPLILKCSRLPSQPFMKPFTETIGRMSLWSSGLDVFLYYLFHL